MEVSKPSPGAGGPRASLKSRLSPYPRLLLYQRIAAGRPVAPRGRGDGGVPADRIPLGPTARAGGERRAHRPVVSATAQPSPDPGRGRGRSWPCDWPGTERCGPAVSLDCPPPRSGRSWPAIGCLCCGTWTGSPGSRSGPVSSELRYQRDRPGELVSVDVKKLGRIPRGGGWRAYRCSEAVRSRDIGYNYVHSTVDDHSARPAPRSWTMRRALRPPGSYSATAWFAGHGVVVERGMTDNTKAYRRSVAWKQAMTAIGARQILIRPHCPWTNCEGVSVLLRAV